MADVEQNKKTAKAFLDAIEKRDIDAVNKLLADDGKFWVIGQFAMSGSKTKPEFMPLVQGMMDMMEPLKFHIEHVTAEDDRVAVAARGEMQTKTGIPYNNTYHFLMSIRDGKIQWSREYFDTELTVKAFGL